jgi:hypothetical protein
MNNTIMADPMETPIDALIENDDDEVTKTIMAELEKHQQEKQKIQEQLHIQHEQEIPKQQSQPQQSQQQSPQQHQEEHIFNSLKDEEVDTSAKEALIIGIICFILLQPSIQNLVFSILPETFRKNGVISSVAIASIIAGSFYVFRKKVGNLF